MATTVENFLETLAENYRIILLGGLAVVAHGLPRTTKDAKLELGAPRVAKEFIWKLKFSIGILI